MNELDSQILLSSSGMCLDIDGKAAENDGIIQRICDPARDTQWWQLKWYDDNFEIVGAHGGMCVEVPDFREEPLIQMRYLPCNPNQDDNDNQRWQSK